MTLQIVLIRHGLSAHVHQGRVNAEEFRRWREAYELAGIAAHDAPPDALKELAAGAGIVVSSDAPRAIQTAQLLTGRAPAIASPLLAELELAPPNLGRVRMPLLAWALVFGLRFLILRVLRKPRAMPHELQRVHAAAGWLDELATRHGAVVAVTHGVVRAEIARELASKGWTPIEERRRSHHWSAWALRRPRE